MQNIGFIKLHRKIRDNPIFWKPNYLAVFTYILLDVEYLPCKKPLRGDLIELQAGEGLFFQKEIADKFGIALGTVSNIIKRLVSENIIETYTNSKYTIIRLINWEAYQGELENTIENELKTEWNPTETQLKHLKNTKKTKNTKKSTRAKKIEAEKKEVFDKVLLTDEQEKQIQELYGNLYKKALAKLSNHKNTKGVTYKSDYHTLITSGWVFSAISEDYPALKEKIEKDERQKEAEELEKKKKKTEEEEKKRTEEEYNKLVSFYNSLSAEEKKAINDRADYELRSFTPKMRESGGKQWENIYKAKVRSVTSTYRDTGELPEVPPLPKEETA